MGGSHSTLLQHHRSHAQALLFYAFDVFVCQGKRLVGTPLEKRWALPNDYKQRSGRWFDDPFKFVLTIRS
jgi:ATP-dependent DNA ligase